MAGKIYIGIAGWSYPDWKDIVYTEPKTDQLEFISRFVDCIEINSTFYRPPFERTTKQWLEKTAKRPDFFFTAKLHKSFTHDGLIDPEIVRFFHKGFEPFLEKGKLKHLLVQFRYDFADHHQTREHLKKVVDCFSGAFPLAVEVRHKSWEQPDALDFFRELGITVCNLDYPTGPKSFDMKLCTVGRNGYIRMHGRNFETWFSKSGRDETYNYYYNEEELTQIEERIEELAKACECLTVIANNHYRGAELANAIELKALINGLKQDVPEGLLKTYPNLARIASNKQLF